MSSNRVIGIPELDGKLAAIASHKEQRRIVRKTFTAGNSVGRKAIRTEVNTSNLSPQLKRALKATIGSSFKKDRRNGQHAAKFGMSIGKRKPARRSGKNKTGVGIGKANVHWFLLGTKVRMVRKWRGRKLNRQRHAGQIKAIPAVANAYRKSANDIQQTMVRTALAEIESTVNRLK